MTVAVKETGEALVRQSKGFHRYDLSFFPTQVMKTDLLAKQNDFLPVAQHGALLFSVINELRELHPYYRFPLESFIQLFRDTVVERNRGKKGSGSPAARAAELITALSRKIFDRTSWSLFQSRRHSFIFFIIIVDKFFMFFLLSLSKVRNEILK